MQARSLSHTINGVYCAWLCLLGYICCHFPTQGRADDPHVNDDIAADELERIKQDLAQREYEISLLRETALAIGSELDIDTVFRIIAQRARELLDAETLLIPILNEDATEYTYRAGAGVNAEEIVGESLPLEFGVCGWVWRHRKPWWRGMLGELSPEERNRWEKEAGTLILVPLIGRQQFLGGIAGINKRGGGEFTERDLHILELFAGQVAIAIENAMAMDRLERAMNTAESYQAELQALNQRLNAVNQELEQLTLYDQLTGLPNRSLFRDRLQRAIRLAQKDNTPLAVMIFDLDRFQEVNDALGHEEGDLLLKQVAGRLADALSPEDTVSRMSADEFAVLVSHCDRRHAIEVARALQAALDRPFTLSSQPINCTATAGIAIYPHDGDEASALLKHADTAMAAAKRARQPMQLYEQALERRTTGRLAMTQDLKNALDTYQFELYYQPKIELATGTLVAVEALSRWVHPERGQVPVDMFISALQQTGLISPFTDRVIDTALAQRRRWLERGWDIRVAVNMPITVILERDFGDRLGGLLEKHGSENGLLFEITENIFLSDYDRLIELLADLQRFGVRFSIDDFGTGHSSLSRLRQLPVDEIKIDRSFIKEMLTNNDDEVIVKSIIDLAHNLGIEVCAEGVESAEVMQHLYRWRCDLVQGFHISKARPAEKLGAFIAASPWNIPRVSGKPEREQHDKD